MKPREIVNSQEESGRPPIDADRTEHRRWINAVLDEYIGLRHKLGSAAPMGYDKAEMARQTAEVREQMVQAYMDGNEAERKTLEFKANEFVVPNDGDYVVAIEQYAVKFAAHYRLSVWHKQKKVLVLYGLTEREFALESDAIRNINSEGP